MEPVDQIETTGNSTQGNTSSDEKKRSNLNALRDLLSGQVTVMTEEDRIAHDKFAEAIVKDLAPRGAMETQLAQRVATDSWRLNRFSAIEDNIFALGFNQLGGEQCLEHVQIDAALTAARVFMRDSKQLQLLTSYEQRINRAIQKNLGLLQSLQATRKAEGKIQKSAPAAQAQNEMAPATLVAEPCLALAAPANGFVSSNDETLPASNPETRANSRNFPAETEAFSAGCPWHGDQRIELSSSISSRSGLRPCSLISSSTHSLRRSSSFSADSFSFSDALSTGVMHSPQAS
jgi:hypothetical protein